MVKANARPTLRSLRTWCVFSARHQEIRFVFSYATTASFTWRRPTETAPRYWRVPCPVPNCGKFSGCWIATTCRGSPKTSPRRRRRPHVSEILQISIFRTDHWQNLVFIDDNGSQPVPRSLGPLVNWLNSLHVQPHRELNEDEGKNNCQSPKKIELTTRP